MLELVFTIDNFLAYSAIASDGGKVDYCSTSNYTFARSRDGTIRTIENVTTDGTFALVTKIPSTRNVYVSGSKNN